MTELVDVIKIEITLHHCRDRLEIKPLRQWLWDNWQDLMQVVEPCTEGVEQHRNETVTFRWEHTGLHEIPELSGGDN